MSASATGWRSKCPYNFGGDAEACDPCPQCDADKPQSPLAASNDAEVGHGVAELQQADWHIPGPCGPENWEQRAVRRVAEVKGDPPKPPLCWICGKPLPHDCVGEAQEQPCWHEAWNASAQALLQDNQASSAKRGSVTVTANGRDIIIGSAHHLNNLLVERADVPDLLVAVVEAYGFKHDPPQSGQTTLTDLPKINLELLEGDTREAKVRWSEWSADRKSLGVCISVTHDPPSNTEVSAIIQSWLDKQGHERCWYYPELFNQLAVVLGLKAAVAPGLPSRQEFEGGCDRYQNEQYGSYQAKLSYGPGKNLGVPASAHQSVTHGLPQGPQVTAANSFAPPASTTATARKWPIGIPANEQAVTQANLKIPVKASYHWGERLIAARAHRGLTLDALGARLNPPRTRKDISAMEHGRRGLSVELCAELAQALDCDRCWLAGWKEGS